MWGLLLSFFRGGYQASELQFGEMYGTIRREELSFGTSQLDGCESEVTNGHLTTKRKYGPYYESNTEESCSKKGMDIALVSSYARS